MNSTKKVIAESLKHLLMKKPITKITIADITEDCGMSRMTFYYHFHDIYDLVEWMCEEEARAALSDNRTYDTWKQGFISLLETVRANKPFILNVYRSVDRAQIEHYLVRVTQKLLLEVIDEQAQGIAITEESKRYVAGFYTYGFIGIMLNWIEDGMREEPAHIAEITSTIIHGDFYRAIERMSKLP
ncbi:MAG: TetR family transcriptional regulator C-terminal domain-containing protein [Clostridia bacterium]|nr:TetR family transcriptional regulator C-terminal domain-containing protein [Clostridia bacterium]